jgi:hypothetical protein
LRVSNRSLTYIIAILLLVLPYNIYLIGDGVGAGIQSPILNYKVTYLGTSLTHEFTELNYALSGVYQGKTALSVMAWFFGFVLLLIALILVILGSYREYPIIIQRSGYIFTIAGLLFLISIFIQYGVLFFGPAGISIPIGIPLIFYVGWYLIHTPRERESASQSQGDETDDTEDPEGEESVPTIRE